MEHWLQGQIIERYQGKYYHNLKFGQEGRRRLNSGFPQGLLQ